MFDSKCHAHIYCQTIVKHKTGMTHIRITHITWYQCAIKKLNIRNGRPTTSNKYYSAGGREDTYRQTSQYYAKEISFTELQWSTGSTYMFQALRVMKTSCGVTLMWQISIFFSLRKNFLVLLNQYHNIFCQEIKHPHVNSVYTTLTVLLPKLHCIPRISYY